MWGVGFFRVGGGGVQMMRVDKPLYWTAPSISEGDCDVVALIKEAQEMIQRQCGVSADMIIPPGHSYSTRMTIDAYISQIQREGKDDGTD